VALRQAVMGVVGWKCGIAVEGKVASRELRDRLGLDDMVSMLQRNRLQWCGRVL